MIVVIGLPSFRPPAEGRAAAASGLAAGVARAAVAAGATVQLIGKIGDDPSGDALVLALARDGIGHVALLRDAVHPTPIDAGIGDTDDFGSDAAGEDADEGDPPDPVRGSASDGPPNGQGSATARRSGTTQGEAADLAADGALPADRALRPSLDAGDLELALRYQADFAVVVVAERLVADARTAVFEAASYASAHVVELLDAGRDVGIPEPDTAFERPASDPEGAFAALVGRYAAAIDAGREPAAAFTEASRVAGWERAPAGD